MANVDAIVAAVPTANREKYEAHVEYSAAVFEEHGATKVVECWGDDVPDGEITSFPKAILKKDDETICFLRGSCGRPRKPATPAGRRSSPTSA